MNLEVLNSYVLVVVVVFGGCLYVAMMIAGYTELVSRLSKTGRKKKSGNGSVNRRGRNVKSSPHS